MQSHMSFFRTPGASEGHHPRLAGARTEETTTLKVWAPGKAVKIVQELHANKFSSRSDCHNFKAFAGKA